MAGTIGGSLRSVKIGGRTFKCPADHDPSRKLGGSENSVLRNGDGSADVSQEEKAWSVTVQIRINDKNEDQEFIQDLADKGEFVQCKLQYRGNVTYGGRGVPVGELKSTAMQNVMELTLEGEDKFERIR